MAENVWFRPEELNYFDSVNAETDLLSPLDHVPLSTMDRKDLRCKLTEKQWRVVIRSYRSGQSTLSIASQFGMTPEGISYGLKKRGERIRQPIKRAVNPLSKVKCYGKCGRTLPATTDFFYSTNCGNLRSKCIDCRKEMSSVFRTKNRVSIASKKRERYWADPEHARKNARDTIRNRKLLVLNHYSGNSIQCACCGEKHVEFMTIDHVDGGGCRHRRIIGVGGGSRFYQWLVRNNFPDGYRVLCMNCNGAYGIYGSCPHQVVCGR